MKKNMLTLVLSVAAVAAFGQETVKVVKSVSLNASAGETLEKLVGDEKLTIDSLVVGGWPGTADYATMREMCRNGRLRGIDLSDAHTEYIPEGAFYAGEPSGSDTQANAVNLSYITLPKKLQGISSRAFSGSKLCAVDISATLMDIADDAFAGCGELKSVVVHSPYVPEKYVSSKVFGGVPSDAVLCVPQGCRANYAVDPRWEKFSAIEEIEGLFSVKTIDLNRGSLETELGDDIYNVDSLCITGEYRNSDMQALVCAVIDGKVRGIDMSGATAEGEIFGNLYYSQSGSQNSAEAYGLRYFRYPNNVKVIRQAWCDAHFLDFTLPESLTEIGRSAFVQCDIAGDIRIPEGVEKISQFAFYDAKAGENMYLPSTLNKVEFASIDVVKKKGEKFNLYINSMVPPVYDRAGNAPLWSETPFTNSRQDNIPDGYTLYVPVGAAEAYRADKCWGHFKNIVETAELDGGTSSIEATTVSADKRTDNRIYTLDGRYVGSDMSRLGNGVYVVNGKKVVR